MDHPRTRDCDGGLTVRRARRQFSRRPRRPIVRRGALRSRSPPIVMSPTRREALAQLAALVALPRAARVSFAPDPLTGTIAEYQAGRRRGQWTAAEVTARALERCRSEGAKWRAIDTLSTTAIADARAADARLRARRTRGPLDGVPVFAKSIYDMAGYATTGSSADWARLFPEPVRHDAIEVARLRAAGAIVIGKTAADD